MKVFAILVTFMVASSAALPIVISPNDIVQRAPGNGHNTGGGSSFRREAEAGNGHNTGGGSSFKREAEAEAEAGNGHNTGGGSSFKRSTNMVVMLDAVPMKRSPGPGNGRNTGGGSSF